MPGWEPDPLRRHQERWNDGARWTDQVRDRGIVNTDGVGLDAIQAPAATSVPTATPLPPARRPPAGAPQFGRIAASGPAPMGDPGTPLPYATFPPAEGVPMVPTVSAGPGIPPPPSYAPTMSPGMGPATGQSAGLSKLGTNSLVTGLLAGALGGAFGMVLAEVLKNPGRLRASTESGLRVQSGLVVLLVGAGLGLVMGAWDAATSSAWEKALRDGAKGAAIGAVAGFVGGYVAQMLYTSMLRHVSFGAGRSTLENKLRLARAAAWAIFGGAMGAGLGIPHGSKKVVNGLVGGAIGGAVGALIFEQLEIAHLNSGSGSGFMSRFLGFIATGVGIGLGVGLIDRLRRDAWLQLTSGPLAGREVILFKPSTFVGADSHCEVVLANDPTIIDRHAVLTRAAGGTTMISPMGEVAVNGARVMAPQLLRMGDRIQIGRSSITFNERVFH